MIVFESRRTRRLVGRLERGESVLDAIAEIALAHDVAAAWISAHGALESAQLVVPDPASRGPGPVLRIGPCHAAHLTGSVSRLGGLPNVSCSGVLVPLPFPQGDSSVSGESFGPGGAAGEVRVATALALEFILDVLDDVALERFPDDSTGLALWRGRAQKPVAQTPAQLGWAAAAKAAERLRADLEREERASWERLGAARQAEREATRGGTPAARAGSATVTARTNAVGKDSTDSSGTARGAGPRGPTPLLPTPEPLPVRRRAGESSSPYVDDEPVPARGEWVSHRQFGLCRVEGEEESGTLAIRLPSGVRKSISLDFLRVLPARTDGQGRTIYPLEPRKR